MTSLLPAYATFGVGTKRAVPSARPTSVRRLRDEERALSAIGEASVAARPAAYGEDRASDFESTGFNSSWTGRIRSRGADGRQRTIKSHVSGPEISGAQTVGRLSSKLLIYCGSGGRTRDRTLDLSRVKQAPDARRLSVAV